MKVIYEYDAEVSIPVPPTTEMPKVRQLLNMALTGKPTFEASEVVSEEVKEAHWYLNAGKKVVMRVVVYENGKRGLK
jgi:hypothetical protein